MRKEFVQELVKLADLLDRRGLRKEVNAVDNMIRTYQEKEEAVKSAVEKFKKSFGETFGLRAFPGKIFKLNERACYYSDSGGVQLYTAVKSGEKWEDFGKGSPAELQSQAVKI